MEGEKLDLQEESGLHAYVFVLGIKDTYTMRTEVRSRRNGCEAFF